MPRSLRNSRGRFSLSVRDRGWLTSPAGGGQGGTGPMHAWMQQVDCADQLVRRRLAGDPGARREALLRRSLPTAWGRSGNTGYAVTVVEGS